MSIKFLLIISMLCKTGWSWEIKTWPNEMKLLDISTTSHYFHRKWIGETIEKVNFHLEIERITCAHFAILLWFYFIASLSWWSFQVHLFLWTEDSFRNSWKACKFQVFRMASTISSREQGWRRERALAFHQCDPGSNPGVDGICGLSLLSVLFLAPRGFIPIFPSPQKPTFSNFNSTGNQVDEEPLTSKSLFISRFITIFIYSFLVLFCFCPLFVHMEP